MGDWTHLAAFEHHDELFTKPLEWKFTRGDMNKLLTKPEITARAST